MVDEDAVAARGEVERDVLVGLLTAGAAVGLPDVDGLAVLHERGEALAETVDVLADAEGELGDHVVDAVRGGREGGPLRRPLRVRRRPSPSRKVHAPGPVAVHAQRQGPAGEFGDRAVPVGAGTGPRGVVRQKCEVRPAPGLARVMGGAHADDTLGRGEAFDRDQRCVERVTARRDTLDRRVRGEPVGVDTKITDLGRVGGCTPSRISQKPSVNFMRTPCRGRRRRGRDARSLRGRYAAPAPPGCRARFRGRGSRTVRRCPAAGAPGCGRSRAR